MAQTFDISPVEAYWKITKSLEQGDSLPVKDWKTFLNIEANQIYVENQGFDSIYLEKLRKNIEYVYMPKYDSLLKARIVAIDKDPLTYWLTYKVYMYKKYEKELMEYVLRLKDPAYLDSIYKNAYQWLPKRLQQKEPTVKISFLGIENDAIAGDGLIISTLWSAYNQDKIKLGILGGHEMHHVLRKPIDFQNVPENEKGILYILNSILNEGSADMIDKTYDLAHDDELPYGSQVTEFLLYQADSIVGQIDKGLAEMKRSEGQVFKTEREYRELIRWTSGHLPGYYMANIIVRNGYKKKLIKEVQNPFSFIYLYNKAAKKDPEHPHVFATESVAYVKHLEEKYMPKGLNRKANPKFFRFHTE